MGDMRKFGVAAGKLFRIDEMTQLKCQVEVPIPYSRELHPSSVGGYLTITVAQAGIDMTCQILRLEYRDGVQYALLQLPWPGSKDESLTSRPTPKTLIDHAYEPGGDDSTFGPRDTWCAVWVGIGEEEDQCGMPREQHDPMG